LLSENAWRKANLHRQDAKNAKRAKRKKEEESFFLIRVTPALPAAPPRNPAGAGREFAWRIRAGLGAAQVQVSVKSVYKVLTFLCIPRVQKVVDESK
jgi:hypothetical protein